MPGRSLLESIMPGSGMAGGDPESLPVLWSPFFENTMVEQ